MATHTTTRDVLGPWSLSTSRAFWEGFAPSALPADDGADRLRTVFLVEAKQAGIFEIRNLPEDQVGQLLGIACPQIVYPYLRGNVADVIQRGGFPPVHLAEINFQAMFEQQQAQAAGQPSAILTQ